ncbi:MAG: replication-relaxation family protein [Gemmataceae bacterium]
MSRSLVTPRDLDLFRALARGPLTVRQVLKLSPTFSAPFPSTRRLQRRLHTLATAGLIRKWWYATQGPGGAAYYTLSPESARMVDDTAAPAPRAYSPIGVSRHFHTQCLQEFLVHTAIAAHRAGIAFADFSPENGVELVVGDKRLCPDAAFTLEVPGLPRLRYFVEIDTGTEPVRSDKPRDSFGRKLRFYEQLRDTGERFRVLGVVTSSAVRRDNLITVAASLARDEKRTVFYGIHLGDYLAHEHPLHQPAFRNHHGAFVALVPTLAQA